VLRPALLARRLEGARQRLDDLGRLLVSVDPDAPLARGYARVTARGGATLTSAAAAKAAGALVLRFADGAVEAKVEGAKGKGYSDVKPEQPTLF
jgi:exodeoxyribonuclease VII large subunit